MTAFAYIAGAGFLAFLFTRCWGIVISGLRERAEILEQEREED